MSRSQITHKQAITLARFLHELRPDWDMPGLEYALGQARQLAPTADLAIAAIRAAGNAGARTPALICRPGAHWRGSETPPRFVEPGADQRCTTCGMARDACRSKWAEDHEFLSVVQQRRHQPVNREDAIATMRAGLRSHDDQDEESA